MPAMAPRYVLITPARNEARFIELTLQSMIAQTHRPLRWVVVSDGSTDGTDDLVRKYAAEHDWIELVRMPERKERHFSGKVHAFNAGRARVADLDYDVIGNLDADVSFPPEHFSYIVGQFASDAELGVAGAPFREGTFQYDYRFANVENVWGGCQIFRKQCFEDIGGYVAIKGGSIDHVAVVSARMKGWKTRTFPGTLSTHQRVMGTAESGGLKAKFKYGIKDYAVGNHPLWQVFRACYQLKQRPIITGGLGLALGYFYAMVKRVERPVSEEFVNFTRQEQMQRLSKALGMKSGPSAPLTTHK